MGTTLEGKQINQTYQGLLKTTDNNEVSSSAKEITDGKGNGTGVTLDNSGNIIANGTITANYLVGDGSQITNLPNSPVNSVNGEIGDVVLDTDNIAEGSNKYYTDARVEANTAVATNTAKVGITQEQADAIVANTAKVGITAEQTADIITNNAKVGITTEQANEIAANTLKTGITQEQSDAIVANTAKIGITQTQADEIEANTLKVGITAEQAADIITNNAKVGITTQQADDIIANNTKVGITTEQANAIVANTEKVGITTQQANEIAANTLKVGITTDQANEIAANTLKTGITTEQANAISANTLKNSYPTNDATKLLGIEAGAQVNTVDSVNSLTGAVSLGLLDLDDVDADGNSGEVLTTDGQGNFTFAPSGGGAGAVTSVNGATGAVVLDTDNIDEGTTNLYYTDTRVSANTDVVANTAKVTRRPIIAGGNTLETSETLTIAAGSNVTITEADGTVTIASSGGGGGGGGAVDSVNGETGVVVLDTDNIDEGATNLYYTDERVSANTDVAANTAKVGITTEQSNAIIANTAKNSYPSADATKVGFISVTQPVDLDTLESDVATNNAKVGITTEQANEIAANTLKTGITTEQANAITANTEKVGITAQQASDITANNAKVSMVLGTTAGTALEGNTPLLQLGTTSTTALAGNTTTITAQQASDITTNNSKVGITPEQAADIVTNNAKVGITAQQAADIIANNAKVGITAQQASDITANNAKISFDSTSSTKLAGIEEGAEVNVNADWNATEGDAQILNKPTLFSGSYDDLTNKPTLATVATTGAYSDLSGTPTLATVATSGSYTDLSNTPTIPTNNNELTNGAGYITDGNTGWDNTYGFITASTTDTLTNKSGSNSQWTNDAGYINEASQTAHTNAIGNAIDFSVRVTLAGGVAEGTSGIIKNLQSIS